MVIQSRYYNVNRHRWEARFFRKGELLPETDLEVPSQGVWAKPASSGWEDALFVGVSWRHVQLEPDLLHLPERGA